MLRQLAVAWAVLALGFAGFPAGAWADEEEDASFEVPPMILQERREATVRVRPPSEREQRDEDVQATPTPRPEDVLVAIVGGRAMTMADLQTRVSARYEALVKEVQSEIGGIVAQFGPDMESQRNLLREQELLEEQKEEIQRALREEESRTVQDWVEFTMLAEEARRQRMAVSDSEFRARNEQLEKEFQIDDELLTNVLTGLQMSRREYERYVYDALMIEKMLKRFISLNYSEDYLRERYEENPSFFYEPERYEVAHFSVVVPDEAFEDRRKQAELRAHAMRARTMLRQGEDPRELFEREEFNRMDEGYFGDPSTWYTFNENILPPIVEYQAKRMKVGDTSDVLANQMRIDGKVVTVSYHVIKIMDKQEATGRTFESAYPAIERSMLELARRQVLHRLREANTHRVVINLGGIPPHRIPSREELIRLEAQAQPISLRLPGAS